MQGLSSRAHAFSVEALVGKTSCKRLKAENCRDEKAPIDSNIKPQDTLACTVVDEEAELDNQTEKRKCSPTKRKAKDGECELEKEVTAELQGSDLWNRFHEIGTEMIITKAGRRMFPSMRVKVKNLDHFKQYYIAMDIMPVDSKRYRYVYHSSQWMVAGNTDHTCIAPRLYVHPDSPCSGETWMRQVISFDRVKLTNNEMDDKGNIILQSMHKYKPRVHVIAHDPRVDRFQIQSLPTEGVRSFSFPETQFTTVTAYQNQQITKLKIDRNPFAKGFRDPGRNRGVLDGILESYPWRSPLSLDFKTFAIEPQEVLAGSSGCGSMSQLKGLLSSSSCSPHPFPLCVPCSEATLRNLSRPLCYKGPPSAGLPGGRPCSLSEPLDTRGHSELRFVADYPFLSALHGKKGTDCRGQFFQGLSTNNPSQLYMQGLQVPGSSRIQQSQPFHGTLPPQLNSPYGLRGYSLPAGPHFTNVGQHLKLGGNATLKSTDSLLPHLPWHPTMNHCL